ncbi:hypothetical protein LOS78_12780 [Paracoccus sp. MA]|nr:hypothetical protein [Paracoccus sp. MA]UFM66801.1 hypothetical protein LOS78_12780 [Paracoccus sp. MA]
MSPRELVAVSRIIADEKRADLLIGAMAARVGVNADKRAFERFAGEMSR